MSARGASRSVAAYPQIPDKLYFRIGEVAQIAGVKPSVLRFWETEFPSLRPEKTRTNQRTYSRRDVERILEIRSLLYEQGFTIAGAKRRLRDSSAKTAGDDNGREAGLIDRVKKELRELLRLVDE